MFPILRLFVHDANQPALVVNDLKLGAREGGVALWIGAQLPRSREVNGFSRSIASYV